MHLQTRNVNTAFKRLVKYFDGQRDRLREAPVVKEQTRNGPVLRIAEPVLITYERPLERVLFNPARDANPAFHLYEALWMLAGRNDVAPLAYYASNMANYSDDGQVLNGAYGFRWRQAKRGRELSREICPESQLNVTVDQLDILVTHLKADPTSRRAVLQMWNVEDDLLKINSSRDVCCNTSVMFSLREGSGSLPHASSPLRTTWLNDDEQPMCRFLDMTVTNRSNDMVWGMLGANYVHFSFLQEYMAARLGAEVGVYHHFTNNLHVYESNWKPKEWLTSYQDAKGNHVYDGHESEGGIELRKIVPLVQDPETFERELPLFVEAHSGKTGAGELEDRWTEPFLSQVAGPMLCAFACHKERDDHSAIMALSNMPDGNDWRFAAEQWIRRRIDRKKGARS